MGLYEKLVNGEEKLSLVGLARWLSAERLMSSAMI